eukprot:Polyplicarium_translucidae@DN3345_c5_g4_i1.p1
MDGKVDVGEIARFLCRPESRFSLAVALVAILVCTIVFRAVPAKPQPPPPPATGPAAPAATEAADEAEVLVPVDPRRMERRAKRRDEKRMRREAMNAQLDRQEKAAAERGAERRRRGDAEDSRLQEEDEAERLAIQRKRAQEEADFQRWKGRFQVCASGACESLEGPSATARFVEMCQARRIVDPEDVADAFGVTAARVRERIAELEASGSLTGVHDDRGKFVAVRAGELHALAEFVNSTGRVSREAFVEACNRLVAAGPRG